MYTHAYAHKNTCSCMTPSTRWSTDTKTHNLCTNMHTHTHTHMYKRIDVQIHTHMHIYTYIMSAHIHTYTYIHTRIQNVHMNARKARRTSYTCIKTIFWHPNENEVDIQTNWERTHCDDGHQKQSSKQSRHSILPDERLHVAYLPARLLQARARPKQINAHRSCRSPVTLQHWFNKTKHHAHVSSTWSFQQSYMTISHRVWIWWWLLLLLSKVV